MIYATPRQEDPTRQHSGGVDLNPGFLQTLGAEAEQSFGYTSIGALQTFGHTFEGSGFHVMHPVGQQHDTHMTREQWENSPYFRKGVKYHDGMTPEDAQYLAHAHDVSKQRQFLLSQSDHIGAKLAGTVVGSLPDPLNFIGVGDLGMAAKGLDMLSHSPMLAHVAGSAAEAGIAVGASQPLVVASQQDIGNNYDWRDALANTLMASTIGAGAGAISHMLHQAPMEERIKGTRVAAAQLANDEPVNVSPYIHSIGERVDIKPALFEETGDVGKASTHAEDRDLAERVVAAKSKPGFLRTANETRLVNQVSLTPDQERAIHIMSQPGFLHTANDKTFLRAFQNGTTDDFHKQAIKEATKTVHSKANYITRMDAAGKADEAQASMEINNGPEISDYAPGQPTFKPTQKIDHSDQFFEDMKKAGTLPEDDQAAYEQAVEDEKTAHSRASALLSAVSCI